MNSQHIVLDARFLRRTTGGIGRYSQALIRELMEQETGHRYTVLIRPADQPEWRQLLEEHPAANLFWRAEIADIPHYSLAEQTRLPQMLRWLAPDLVHFTNFNHPILWLGRFVVTIHDLTIQKYPVGPHQSSRLFQFGFRQVLRHAARRAQAILTVSETSKNDLASAYHIPPEKIQVTYEGVDPIYQPLNLPQRGRQQGLLPDQLRIRPPFFLFVSQWRPHKGLSTLIEAYELLRDAYPKLAPQLVVVGQPNPAYPELPDRIERSPYRGDMILPGFVAEADLVRLYQTATAFVFPSLYEGFGLPPLEAMAAGTPVVASQTSCLPEILGDAALYAEPANPKALAEALAEVVTKTHLWRHLRAAGLAQARQYSWQKMAKETAAIYENALKARV